MGASGNPAQQANPPANATGLPDALKSGIESLSGQAMADVRIHYNSNEPAKVNAAAFSRGNDIYIAPGQEDQLPHEAWHVVQQKQGRVSAEVKAQGSHANKDPGLENEAKAMAARFGTSGN